MVKKILVLVAYFFSPAIPLLFYLKTSGTGFDSYSLSVFLGVFAYILICNQFILASRPSFVINALGMKGFLSLHGTAPVFVLIIVAFHRSLKVSSGFPVDTFQALAGALAALIIALVTVFTVLLMANTFVLKLAVVTKLKDWIYRKTGLTYKGARVLHNVTVFAALALLAHVFLSSSSLFSLNPLGICWLTGWMVVSLGLYLRYRLKGRHS